MRVTHLVTYPRTIDPQRDAVAQDVLALGAQTESRIIHIAPPEKLRAPCPERLFGLWLLPQIARLNDATDVFHLHHAHPRLFWLLRALSKPVIYSITSGLRVVAPPGVDELNRRALFVVSNERDAAAMTGWGISNVRIIRAGIDLSRFANSKPPATEPFHIVVASAPWTKASFAHKGIDALLDVMTERPQLRATFLWRNWLYDQMMARVAQRNLHDRAIVLNERVDVASLLRSAHAAYLISDDASLVKAYPNSLMEAIACGRPVLTSAYIPMADDVRAFGCGVVIERVNREAVRAGLDELMSDYAQLQQATLRVPADRYSRERWVQEHVALYREIGIYSDHWLSFRMK